MPNGNKRGLGLGEVSWLSRQKQRNRHRRLNEELIARTGSHVDQATMDQLRRRIQLLEHWRDRGYDGKC